MLNIALLVFRFEFIPVLIQYSSAIVPLSSQSLVAAPGYAISTPAYGEVQFGPLDKLQ
jgi:hypothetical protein